MSNKPPGEPADRVFIQGYQVFCNEAGQPGSASRPSGDGVPEKDPDDLPVTFEVKTEPVDPDFENSGSPASMPSPAPTPTPTVAIPSPRPRPQLKDVLPRLKQIQQMNSSAPANVIDELVKNNEFLLAKNDAEGYKPNFRKARQPVEAKRPENLMESSPQTFLVSPSSQARISAVKSEPGQKGKDARYGKILRPRSPTRKCTIPEKDKSHFNYALMESSVKDKSSEKIFRVQKHEMVCAVTCKAMFMTQGGAFKGDFDLQFYWCNFCTFHTTNKAQLIQHGMEHRFHCKFCRYQSFSRADIIHHTAKTHADDFREAANSLKYCILLSDYLQIYSQDTDEDRKKRAADDDNDEGPSEKAAKLEGRSVDSLSPDELKKLQNDYQIFDMDVETVDEVDKNTVTEEPSVAAPMVGNIASDKQVMATSDLATYETSKAINNVVIADGSFQPTIVQNISSLPITGPIPVSLVPANTRPVIISRLAAPVTPIRQLLTQSIVNTPVRLTSGTTPRMPTLAPAPMQGQRALENRPPPPPPSNKTKPGQGSTVSSSLYWSCGYCSFTSHSQSEIKEHSQKLHRGKPHRYVALIMPSDKQTQNSQNSDGAKGTNDAGVSGKEIEIDNAEDASDSVPMESDSESFKCFHCSFLVKKPELIKEHLFAKHPSLSMVGVDIHSTRLKNIFYCPRDDCPFRSKSPSMFQAHVERCTPWQIKDLNMAVEKHLLDCLENTIKFSKAVQLKEQVSTTLNELSCIYCSYNSPFASRVKRHVIMKHPHKPMRIRLKPSHSTGLSQSIYFCTLCSWHTRIKYRREEHMLNVHHIENDDVRDGNIQVYHENQFRKRKFVALDEDSSNVDCPNTGSADESEENEIDNHDDGSDVLMEEDEEMQSMENTDSLTEDEDQISNYFYVDNTNHTVYRCLFCFGECTGISAIKSHLQNVHSSQKMQVLNVEKCNNQEKCVFFVCPEEHCRVLFIMESLLIEHAQSHESMCVSPTGSTSNTNTDMTAIKTFKPLSGQDVHQTKQDSVTCTPSTPSTHTTMSQPTHISKQTVTSAQNNTPVVANSATKPLVVTSSAPSQVISPLIWPSGCIGNTQNNPVVLAEQFNPLQLASVTLGEVLPQLTSMPSIFPPCPGGLRIALWRTNLGVSVPSLCPQLGPTVGTNSPLPIGIPPSNKSFSLVSPTGIVTSIAPPLETSVPLQGVGQVGVPQLVLRMVPPVPHIPQPTTGLVNTAPTYPLEIASTDICVDSHLRPTPLCSSLNMSKVDDPLEDCIPQTECKSDHNKQLVKRQCIKHESSEGVPRALLEKLLTETSDGCHSNTAVGGSLSKVGDHSLCAEQGRDKTVNIISNATKTHLCRTDKDDYESKPKIMSDKNRPKSDPLAKSICVENKKNVDTCIKVETNDSITDKVNPKRKNSSKAKIKSKKNICDEKTVKLELSIKDKNIDSTNVCHNPEESIVGQADPACSSSASSTRRITRNAKKQSESSNSKMNFRCKFCKFSVAEGVLLIKSHIVENHPEEKLETYYTKGLMSKQSKKTYYLCPSEDCVFCFDDESMLVEHWMSIHENEEITSADDSDQNSKEASKSEGKKKSSPQSKSKMAYECLYCLLSHMEADLDSMKKHYQDEHQGQEMVMRDLKVGSFKNSRIVICNHPGCSYQSENAKELSFQYHRLAHSTSKIYKCSLCEWFSADSCAATEHLLLSHAKRSTPGVVLELSLELQSDGTVKTSNIYS